MLTKDEYKALQEWCSRKFQYAQKIGKAQTFVGPTKCTDCGGLATMFDHRNYYKPFEVEPVCRKCNMTRGAAYPYCEDHNQSRAGLEALLPDAEEDYTGKLAIDFDFSAYDDHNEYMRIFGRDQDIDAYAKENTNAKRAGHIVIGAYQKIYHDGELRVIKRERAKYKANEYSRERYKRIKRAKP